MYKLLESWRSDHAQRSHKKGDQARPDPQLEYDFDQFLTKAFGEGASLSFLGFSLMNV
jgi:hypothetical protein